MTRRRPEVRVEHLVGTQLTCLVFPLPVRVVVGRVGCDEKNAMNNEKVTLAGLAGV